MELLLRIVVEDILAFAYSDESQINEEFSVNQLERIAEGLLSSNEETLRAFQTTIEDMAAEARANGQMGRAEQIESMPLHLGLIE